MKKKLQLFFILLSVSCFAQFSKTHYIPPLISSEGFVEDHYLYISTPSISDVNFKIIANGGTVLNRTVNSTTPYRLTIGRGDDTQLFTPITKTGIISNKGYVIEAEDLVYVSVRVNAGRTNSGAYNHAGGLVSKGNSALGKEFRLGAMLNPLFDTSLLNFASILATENGTKITISDLPNGTRLLNMPNVTGSFSVTLNKNESYVLALQNYNDGAFVSNSSKMIGALVKSDKPVVVNCGSFGGSNSTEIITQDGITGPGGRDLGFDQIVSSEKTGNEYVFVKGIGTDELERVLLIANSPGQTEIFLNGNSTPLTTLNNGEHIVLDGSQFANGNMYITASQNLFAYQSIGGSDETSFFLPSANQNMFFVPPINCSTPNTVDNIPQIQSIGNTNLTGVLNIVTETGAVVSLNNNTITSPPIAIVGNPKFVRYTIYNLSGNISVKSDKQVYVSYFGTNGAATYGGYYSGFDLKPEIVTGKLDITTSACIPNVSLNINALTSYDSFQWYKDDVEILGETLEKYNPTVPGFYQVKGSISNCISDVFSDKIPVSECPIDNDNDLVNDNIDIDYDNDGILNCAESYGNQAINSSINSGVVTTGSYSNSFSRIIDHTTPAAPIPFAGNLDGSFVTEVMGGKGFYVSSYLEFTNPINLKLEYVSTANTADLLNTDAEFVINSDVNKTITVLNPSNQLLIDTNYDGIYESGVTQFSSFEIRFRLNGSIPLVAGTGTFSFQSYQTKSLKITHKNLLDTAGNKATFKLSATCLPKDSDNDGIPDQLDFDSDNDGIPDLIENQKVPKPLSNTDSNLDGLDDMFEVSSNIIDTDTDGVADYLDLDSDNDGIYDLIESGSNAVDSDKNGIIDLSNFGTNGLANSLETSDDSGILNYTVADTDANGIMNFTELDSDKDLCNDVIEAGFPDTNGDGILGSLFPPSVDSNGKVTSGAIYNTPVNANYTISAPIVITSQPATNPICELETANITVADNGGNSYQWQLSIDGINWNNLLNDSNYSGIDTNTLTINSTTNAMINYKYRVQLSKTGNTCGLTSEEVMLNILSLPVLNSPVTIVQCDDDTDGITNFNITEKNSFISTNYADEEFSYYTSLLGANTKDATTLISSQIAFTSANNTIWARVENVNGCFSVAKLNLIVSITSIRSSFKKTIEACDDFIDNTNDDKDGITTFDLSDVIQDIQNELPSAASNYGIKFYTNEVDALAEKNTILDPIHFRNTSAYQQDIWVRVDSNFDNACFGLGPYVSLIVNPRPNIETTNNKNEPNSVCSNLPSFFITLDAGIIDSTPIEDYKYVWSKDGIVIPNENNYTLDVNEEGIYTVIVSTQKDCDKTRTITIKASDIAHLDSVSISDLSDSKTVTANVSGQGNYEYSIDLPNGPFQDSNYFENVPSGIHELYINDKNGCGIIKQMIAVLGIPKFFTPNNDGYNDFWKIVGADETFNNGAKIFIYDRYGKLIKQIFSSNDGWDGTYIGNQMPSDDYWYTIKLEDGREAKGHFSLKR